jgi:hypothetical protein
MFPRMRQRLARLEQAITPKGRVFVFFRAETSPPGPGLPPYAEQLAAFKTKNDVGPHDTVIEVVLTFDA